MPISYDDRCLITNWGGAICWDEIVALHISKVDAIDRTLTILTFDCSNGEFVEVNIDEPGFDEVRSKLPDYLPLSHGWYDRVESMPLTETYTAFDRRANAT